MRTWMFEGIIGIVLLLNTGYLQSVHASGLEPLDGRHGVFGSDRSSERRPERGPLLPSESQTPAAAPAQGNVSSHATPSGEPSPKNQLTPSPVLPFNPNGPLMPSPQTPPPVSGSGRMGR